MTTRLLKNPPAALKVFPLDRTLRDYAALKARVGEVLIAGRKRIEKEFMLMRYHTGFLINEHIRLNSDRSAYGAKAVLKLGEDFDIDYPELTRYAKLARAYPIVGRGQQLRFSLNLKCYRKLMIIKDDKQRWEMTLRAEKNEWNFEEVEAKVQYAIGKEEDEKQPPRLQDLVDVLEKNNVKVLEAQQTFGRFGNLAENLFDRVRAFPFALNVLLPFLVIFGYLDSVSSTQEGSGLLLVGRKT